MVVGERTWDARCTSTLPPRVGSSRCVCVNRRRTQSLFRHRGTSCAFHYHQRRNRHRDAAYRDARCGSVSVSISLSPRLPLLISLFRDARYERTVTFSVCLFRSRHLLATPIRAFFPSSSRRIVVVSYFVRTAADARLLSPLGITRTRGRREAAAPIDVDVPPLVLVDKFSSRMSGRTSRGLSAAPADRILNRDDLDDAFECIPMVRAIIYCATELSGPGIDSGGEQRGQ